MGGKRPFCFLVLFLIPGCSVLQNRTAPSLAAMGCELSSPANVFRSPEYLWAIRVSFELNDPKSFGSLPASSLLCCLQQRLRCSETPVGGTAIGSPFHLWGTFCWWQGLHPTADFGKRWQCHLTLLWQVVACPGLHPVKEGL